MSNSNFNIFEPRIRYDLCKGCLLIAKPFLNEPYFSRYIILLCEYDSHGAMGFVLNKPTNIYPDEMFDTLNDFRDPLYLGGPVGKDNLYFVHRYGRLVPGSQPIADNLWYGGDFEVLQQLINRHHAQACSVRFFAGYSGWDKAQLENEIRDESWIVAPLDNSIIFSHLHAEVWSESLRRLGDVYRFWANFPLYPQLN